MTMNGTGSRYTRDSKRYDYFFGEKVKKEIPEERIRLYEGIFILLVTIGLIVATKAL